MSDLTLKEKLQAKIQENAGINPPESSIPVAAAPVAPAGASPLDKFRKTAPAPTLPPGRAPLMLVPQPAAAPAAAPTPAAPAAATTAPLSALDKIRQRQATAAAEAQPAAAPATVVAPVAAPVVASAPTAGGSALEKIRARQATAPAEVAAVVAAAPAVAPTPAPAPGGSALEKIRAKQSEAAPAPAPVSAATDSGTLQQYPDDVAQRVSPSLGQPQRVFTLLINCRMVRPNISFVTAADIVEEANAIVCEELGVFDYSLAEYGKGRGALAVSVQRILQRKLDSGEMNPGDTIMLFTSDRAESDCVDAFLSYSDRVIRS